MVAADPQSPYLKDPEVRLMLRVREGDDEAFTQLVSRYQHRLVSLFAGMLDGDTAAAEDLAQDVFLRVYRARNGYQPTAKFSTWVFRIANHLAINSLRTMGRRKEVQFKPVDSGPLGLNPQEKILAEKSGLMPGRQVDKVEMQKQVLAAVGNLNDRQRMAVLLHKFEEMSYADIGETMELSPEAVKSLLSRARDNLRIALEPFAK